MTKIPFNVHNYKLIDQMPKDQETREGVLFTTDEDWIKKSPFGAI